MGCHPFSGRCNRRRFQRGELAQASINMPQERIAGTVGAGDAFAAGLLLGLHEDVPIEVALTYGVCAAAASLLDPASTNGVKPLSECSQLVEEFGYRPTLKL
jgi:sugar/nucleoside kinase (ribokinase family)